MILIYICEIHLHGLVTFLQSQTFHHNVHICTPFLLVLLLLARDSTDVDQIFSVTKTSYYIPCIQTPLQLHLYLPSFYLRYGFFYVYVSYVLGEIFSHKHHTWKAFPQYEFFYAVVSYLTY